MTGYKVSIFNSDEAYFEYIEPYGNAVYADSLYLFNSMMADNKPVVDLIKDLDYGEEESNIILIGDIFTVPGKRTQGYMSAMFETLERYYSKDANYVCQLSPLIPNYKKAFYKRDNTLRYKVTFDDAERNSDYNFDDTIQYEINKKLAEKLGFSIAYDFNHDMSHEKCLYAFKCDNIFYDYMKVKNIDYFTSEAFLNGKYNS